MNLKKFIKRRTTIIGAVLGAVRGVTVFLGPGDDWVERVRKRVYRAADDEMSDAGRPTTRKKGPADYVTTVHATADAVERAIHPQYQRNVTSTRKYRDVDEREIQWAVGSWVYDPKDTEWQHHVYLFESPDGGCDVYAHRETSVRYPYGHLDDAQEHGDPNGRVRGILHAAGFDIGRRDLSK